MAFGPFVFAAFCGSITGLPRTLSAVIRLLNRLSDHLFVLGRRLNAGGDVLWTPGANR